MIGARLVARLSQLKGDGDAGIDGDLTGGCVAGNEEFYAPIIRTIATSKQPHIVLEYENLGSRPEQKRMLDFLRVNSSQPRLAPASVKLTPTDLRTVVSNFSELDSALSGTEYQRELHDVSP